VIDPRTTNIVGERVQVVKRSSPTTVLARGAVRVVDYNQGTFVLLVEATEAMDSDWCTHKGELFQVSVLDEWTEVLVDGEKRPA
jgi:hypothetical protein